MLSSTQGWANMTVWGFQDSPISWIGREHGHLVSGENMYSFFLWPSSVPTRHSKDHPDQGVYVLLENVAAHDAHSWQSKWIQKLTQIKVGAGLHQTTSLFVMILSCCSFSISCTLGALKIMVQRLWDNDSYFLEQWDQGEMRMKIKQVLLTDQICLNELKDRYKIAKVESSLDQTHATRIFMWYIGDNDRKTPHPTSCTQASYGRPSNEFLLFSDLSVTEILVTYSSIRFPMPSLFFTGAFLPL